MTIPISGQEQAGKSPVRSGDVEAYRRLRRFAAIVAPSDVEPDDLLHDALLCVARVKGIDMENMPEPYLRTTMVNLVRSHARRRPVADRARRLVGATDHAPAADTGAAILDRLKPGDRALLYMIDVEGGTYEEAAATLDIKPAAARKRAERARARLRDELKEQE